MKYLGKKLLIPFNIKDKYGYYYDNNSWDWDQLIQLLENGGIFGTIGFGKDINIKDLSHEITDIKITSNGIYGHVRTLDTPKGKILEELIGNDIDVVYRPRVQGEVDMMTMYIKVFTISHFNAINIDEDSYGDIIYRNKKLKLLLDEIQKG